MVVFLGRLWHGFGRVGAGLGLGCRVSWVITIKGGMDPRHPEALLSPGNCVAGVLSVAL